MKIQALPNANQKLKIAANKKGMNLTNLADKLNISIEHLSRVMSNTVHPSGKLAERIASALEMSFEELFTRDVELDRFNNDVITAEEKEILELALENYKIVADKKEYLKMIDKLLDELE